MVENNKIFDWGDYGKVGVATIKANLEINRSLCGLYCNCPLVDKITDQIVADMKALNEERDEIGSNKVKKMSVMDVRNMIDEINGLHDERDKLHELAMQMKKDVMPIYEAATKVRREELNKKTVKK